MFKSLKVKVKVSVCVLLSLVFFCGIVIAFAAEGKSSISAGETYEGDIIVLESTVDNKGIIKGDLIALSQTLVSDGNVEGDIIAGANEINISGQVGGNIRVGGNNISIASEVERNVMLFGSNVIIGKEAIIKGNVYLFGTVINSSGSVLGKTDIFGANITLSGNYDGDVYIHEMEEGSTLEISSGTVIRGKLTYEGVTEFEVPDDVKVGSYEFVKIDPVGQEIKTASDYVLPLVKKVFTLIVYYLFALLLYKLFPRFFSRSGSFIAEKFFSAAGIGIATFGSLIGGLIFLFILLLLTIFIFNGSIFFFAGLLFIFAATVTILFADIPVSLWLGNTITKGRMSVPARLAIGLALIFAVKLVLEFLSNIQSISTLVGILSFIINVAIWILGTGALLKTIYDIMKSANIQSQAEGEVELPKLEE